MLCSHIGWWFHQNQEGQGYCPRKEMSPWSPRNEQMTKKSWVWGGCQAETSSGRHQETRKKQTDSGHFETLQVHQSWSIVFIGKEQQVKLETWPVPDHEMPWGKTSSPSQPLPRNQPFLGSGWVTSHGPSCLLLHIWETRVPLQRWESEGWGQQESARFFLPVTWQHEVSNPLSWSESPFYELPLHTIVQTAFTRGSAAYSWPRVVLQRSFSVLFTKLVKVNFMGL